MAGTDSRWETINKSRQDAVKATKRFAREGVSALSNEITNFESRDRAYEQRQEAHRSRQERDDISETEKAEIAAGAWVTGPFLSALNGDLAVTAVKSAIPAAMAYGADHYIARGAGNTALTKGIEYGAKALGLGDIGDLGVLGVKALAPFWIAAQADGAVSGGYGTKLIGRNMIAVKDAAGGMLGWFKDKLFASKEIADLALHTRWVQELLTDYERLNNVSVALRVHRDALLQLSPSGLKKLGLDHLTKHTLQYGQANRSGDRDEATRGQREQIIAGAVYSHLKGWTLGDEDEGDDIPDVSEFNPHDQKVLRGMMQCRNPDMEADVQGTFLDGECVCVGAPSRDEDGPDLFILAPGPVGGRNPTLALQTARGYRYAGRDSGCVADARGPTSSFDPMRL